MTGTSNRREFLRGGLIALAGLGAVACADPLPDRSARREPQFTDHYFTALDTLLLGYDVQKGGFSRTVFTDNANTFTFGEVVVKFVQDGLIAIGFGNIVKLQDLASHPFHVQF